MSVESPEAPVAEGRQLSRFGTMWTDRSDAGRVAYRMLEVGEISEGEYAALTHFIAEGYVVLKGVLGDAQITPIADALEAVLSGQTPRNMTFWASDGHHNEPARRENLMQTQAKVLDMHAVSSAVQDVIFAPRIRRFLELVFKDRALAFQNLYFHRGSQQGIHQDTAFVPVADKPLDFVASWIALEDVQAGTGELLYVPRSHRLPDLEFAGGGKKCTPEDPRIKQYTQLVKDNYEAAGLESAAFLPRKGDVLFWAADLCHGGAKIEKPDSTRRSIVTHYCPLSRRPEFAVHGRFDVRETASGGYIVSQT